MLAKAKNHFNIYIVNNIELLHIQVLFTRKIFEWKICLHLRHERLVFHRLSLSLVTHDDTKLFRGGFNCCWMSKMISCLMQQSEVEGEKADCGDANDSVAYASLQTCTVYMHVFTLCEYTVHLIGLHQQPFPKLSTYGLRWMWLTVAFMSSRFDCNNSSEVYNVCILSTDC